MARAQRTDEELEREIAEAIERGRAADATEPRAARAWYDAESHRIMVELTNGVLFGFPVGLGQGLQGASAEDLAAVEIEGNGYGLHWEALDADLSVPGLVAGVFGTREWMREMGRRGGSATSDAKARAARANGLKGGRPKRKDAGTGTAHRYGSGSSARRSRVVREPGTGDAAKKKDSSGKEEEED